MAAFDYLAIPCPEGKDPKDHNAHPFEELYSALLGSNEHEHFVVHQNELFCIRPSCDGCAFAGNGCEFEETQIPTSSIPHARRGIGFEEVSFLVLRFKEGHSYETLPVELWDNPDSERAYGYESNLHWAYTDLDTTKFHSIKQQLRYYGTREEFDASPYAEYFVVYNEYVPQHHVVSLDYSAIEPRVSTLVAKEPQWIEVFQGEPKVIFKQVQITGEFKAPKQIMQVGNKTYCFLKGEMDKDSFEGQCAKCALKDQCTTLQDHLKNVPTDWHGINTSGLYGDQFTKASDKFAKKALRDIGKIVGLALCYGGSAFTVSNNMGSTIEEAQQRIDNFFRKLTVLAAYMTDARQKVLRTGVVLNLFGRARDVSEDAFSNDRKLRGYAERTALNHPIQSTAADLLKLGHIKADDFIMENGLNPYAGPYAPQEWEQLPHYTDVQVAMTSSIHDEVMYIIRTNSFDIAIPKLYSAMQLEHVLKQFGLGFSLELDCEYDKTRSWTSSEKFDTANVYLLRHLQQPQGSERGDPAERDRPGLALIEADAITPELLHRLSTYEPAPDTTDEDYKVELGVLTKGHYYLHGQRFSEAFLRDLGLSYRLVHYHHTPLN